MSHETHPPAPSKSADPTPQHIPAVHFPAALPRNRWQKWLEAASAALERTEKRITDNFRVPPNGG